MANRVVMGALPGGGFGLRVSKPGIDVLNPSISGKNLSFDSGWAAAAKIRIQGSVSVPSSSSAFQYTTVNFGKTFSQPPPVILLKLTGSTWEPLVEGVQSGSDWTDSKAIHRAQIFTDRMRFYRFPTESYTVHYIVIDDL